MRTIEPCKISKHSSPNYIIHYTQYLFEQKKNTLLSVGNISESKLNRTIASITATTTGQQHKHQKVKKKCRDQKRQQQQQQP